jgi:dihydropteroate synthase
MKIHAENKAFLPNYSLNVDGRLLDLSSPVIMGILNVTPDSFYDGSAYPDMSSIILRVSKMLEEGADIIDVGGHSTRPGAIHVPSDEEKRRVIPVITELTKSFPGILISIDSFQTDTIMAAVEAGARIINDVSGGNLDQNMFNVVSELRLPYILTHMRGSPETMAHLVDYQTVTLEVISEIQQKLAQLEDLGVRDVIIDPGFGFAKNILQNFELLSNLHLFRRFGRPILAGLSRKSMVWKSLGISPDKALNGTSVLNTIALQKGVSVLRVHDVKEAVETRALLAMMVS